MSQLARPIATSSQGSWTTVGAPTPHEALDEVGIDDSDYVTTSQVSDLLRVKLSAFVDPQTTSGYTLRYRLRSPAGGSIVVRLVQGASTVIATWTHAPAPANFTDFARVLTSAQIAAITVPGDLYVEIESGAA